MSNKIHDDETPSEFLTSDNYETEYRERYRAGCSIGDASWQDSRELALADICAFRELGFDGPMRLSVRTEIVKTYEVIYDR